MRRRSPFVVVLSNPDEEALLAAEAAEAKKASADDKAESSKNLSEAALIRFVYHQIVLGARIRNH
jgi:hypothetical protein